MSVKPRFIISDLHFGEGRQSPLEDFTEEAAAQLVKFFGEASALGGVRMIINGDFIDFPQILLGTLSDPPQKYLGTTESESALKLQKAIAGHPEEFEAIKNFLAGKGNELLIVPGNHDVDFAWNRVLGILMKRIGATPKNFKFGMVYKEGGVFVTHGHQYSDDNQIDVPVNVTFNRLNSCWGTYFVEHFFNQIEARWPLLDNARPMWKSALSAVLHDEVVVTAKFAAELLMFLKNFRAPLKDYVQSSLFGAKRKTRALRQQDMDDLTDGIKLNALRERLQELRGKPAFRREFDATVQAFSETQREHVFARQSGVEYELLDQIQDREARPHSRGMFDDLDHYQQAAKLIARHHPGTRCVIMGHTHHAVPSAALDIDGGSQAFTYINTGTWTANYAIPAWSLPKLETLCDESAHAQEFGVARCLGEDDALDAMYFDDWRNAMAVS